MKRIGLSLALLAGSIAVFGFGFVVLVQEFWGAFDGFKEFHEWVSFPVRFVGHDWIDILGLGAMSVGIGVGLAALRFIVPIVFGPVSNFNSDP